MKNRNLTRVLLSSLAAGASLAVLPPVQADDTGIVLEEIVVTSRKRAESLQDVPDSVTAFGASTIERAGIDDVQDFIDMTPNIMMRETFRAGVTFISIRGISTGQQGWPPITYVVDGVQSGSLDAINQGSLVDIERIEVLKGPQGALYGAGAIAGAINVVTKKPTNEREYAVKASYAKGNDLKLSGMASGPIVEDKVLYRLNAYYNKSDGLIDSTDGVDLDFEEQVTLRGRLLFNLSDDIELDVKGEYTDVEAGAAYQEKLPSADLIETFDDNWGTPERGLIGYENRQLINFSAKLDWQLDFGTLTAVGGYSDIEQDLFATASWGKPPTASIFGPVGGPDDAFEDAFQDLADNFETTTFDIRLTSNSDQDLRWMFGASYLDRTVLNVLGVGMMTGGTNRENLEGVYFLNRPDVRKAEMWGLYGQLNYDITEDLELTVAGRYDENNYNSTTYTDRTLTEVVQLVNPEGDLVDTLKATDNKFQPKVQLSYNFSDDVMGYATYATGFRTGFFATGNLTLPETTKNYEVGFKSTLADGRVRLNGALFHIDYSDQQFTFILAEPPFRDTTNIPSTNIDGMEVEITAALTESLELSGGIGVVDADVADGTTAPTVPNYTANLSASYTQPINDEYDFLARVDYRKQGRFYMDAANAYKVTAKDYVDARISLRSEQWLFGLFVDNLTNERQPNSFTDFGIGFVRAVNKPRSYGIEASYKF
ncbi:TonB-dependent receptor [Kordiimonas sediminis]|uniref:TonB-dependent receptor n=1 Tax=Kordiimonas sediminis TaxID=1735581 RepID=A0A919E4S4_9PROT|nr:TonB-dependent receptor [Kordiimonas sediminis]GHF13589.1 TonB-dependent receptor [Kordiimonas sediminis]